MTSTSLGNPNKTTNHGYFRNNAAELFANANKMYNHSSHNKMKVENLHEVLNVTDSTGAFQRSINMLHNEVTSISEQLQALEQSEIDIRETQETYKEEWHHVEIQRRALANEILHMETTHARYPQNNFM